MNRSERRRAAAMMRRTPIPRETLVHEAGHAVGRILVAEAAGWAMEEAIHEIKLSPAPPSLARVRGPNFSKCIEAFLRANGMENGVPDGSEMAIIAKMRADGIDVEGW